jgi:hypothetical protein
LGIGEASPATDLHITNSGTTQLLLESGNTSRGILLFGDAEDLNVGSLTYDHSDNSMRFETSDTERMRIDSSGNMIWKQSGIQIVPPVNQTVLCGDSGWGQTLRFNTSLTSARGVIGFFYNSSAVGGILTNTTSTSYNTSSDYRLKEDWQPVATPIDRVKALNPVNFAWKATGERVDGFLAHEAQEVVPEAVHGTKDAMRTEEYEVTPAVLDDDGNVVTEAVMGTRSVPDYQGIDQSKLVPLLTAALQEAITKIETLEHRIDALEGN